MSRREALRQTHHRQSIRSNRKQRATSRSVAFIDDGVLGSIRRQTRSRQRFFRKLLGRGMITGPQQSSRRMETKRARQFDIIAIEHFITNTFELFDRPPRLSTIRQQTGASDR